ncbi:AAA family ATPase [Pasteurellaceae bacterium LIM206]|nr:AAA family ATPase [Pasteurellaceae bacterium LIM206]
MVKIPIYLEQLKPFIDTPFIKIITELRRSGKSTVLKLLQEKLFQQKVSNEQIIYINFESFSFTELKSATKLYEFIKKSTTS